MKRLRTVLAVLAILVVAVGFYRGWFTLSSTSSNAESHKVNVNLAVDPDKVKSDAETVTDKASQAFGNPATLAAGTGP